MNTKAYLNKEFDALIVGFLTGSITPDELDQLQILLSESTENKNHFNKIKDAWITAGQPVSSNDLNLRWQEVLSRIDGIKPDDQNITKGRVGIKRYLMMAASWVLFLAAGSGLTWLILSRHQEKATGTVEMSVPLGARSYIRMPDGTGIWLNAGTTITYDASYGEVKRKINLTGEAFFDVAKDTTHPFIVHTSGMDVRAVGTRFNVKAYPDEKTIAATLEEGRIDVKILEARSRKSISLGENEKIILLKPTQKSEVYTENADEKVFEKGTNKKPDLLNPKLVSVLSHVNTQLYTSWKDNRWIIQGEELGTLAPMFERRFNIRILFGNDAIKRYKFSGTIENETVDQIMELLTLTAPIEYTIDKDLITLNLNKRNILEFGKTMTHNK